MRAVLLALLAAAPALAQNDPPDGDAATLMASFSVRDQAWGAYFAGERNEAGAVPALKNLLERHRDSRDAESRIVRATALDALIRMRAPIGWKELKPHFRSHRAEVLVLLAQDPRAHQAALVELLDEGLWTDGWLLVRNLLVARRAPGLAAHLLRALRVKLTITVRDPGSGIGGRSGGRSGGAGDGRIQVREGWPPVVRYSICGPLYKDRAKLIAPGKHPVYLRRIEVKEGTRGFGSIHRSIDRDQCRIDYLGQLLGKSLDVRKAYYEYVDWQGAQSYLEAALRARHKVEGDFRRTVAALVERGLVTKEEAAGLEPRVAVTVRDWRKIRAPVLPDLPG